MTTHNLREMPVARLRLPQYVQHGGRIYRAWNVLPVAQLPGFVLDARDSNGVRTALMYATADATVQVVIG